MFRGKASLSCVWSRSPHWYFPIPLSRLPSNIHCLLLLLCSCLPHRLWAPFSCLWYMSFVTGSNFVIFLFPALGLMKENCKRGGRYLWIQKAEMKSIIKNKQHRNLFFSELESQKVPDILGLDCPMYCGMDMWVTTCNIMFFFVL